MHGFSKMDKGGIIRIYGWLEDDACRFCVEDNGRGFNGQEDKAAASMAIGTRAIPGMHIGIANVDKRIKLLYGDAYGVRIDSRPGGGTSVFITLPA
jgi:two-component system sensor histidine kinase YesM